MFTKPSFFRKNGNIVATLLSSSLLASVTANVANTTTLTCSAKKWFWVSWVNGLIQLGRGNQTGYDKLLVFNDSNPTTINYMGVSALSGTGKITNWTIPGEFYTKGYIQLKINVLKHIYHVIFINDL